MNYRETGPLSGMRILIVEDEPLLAMDLAEDVEAAGGMVVGPVSSVAAAFGLLEVDTVHAAVLDVDLGGELVFPLADALMARAIRFLFTTGYDATGIAARYERAPVFEKPFALIDLIEVIARLD